MQSVRAVPPPGGAAIGGPIQPAKPIHREGGGGHRQKSWGAYASSLPLPSSSELSSGASGSLLWPMDLDAMAWNTDSAASGSKPSCPSAAWKESPPSEDVSERSNSSSSRLGLRDSADGAADAGSARRLGCGLPAAAPSPWPSSAAPPPLCEPSAAARRSSRCARRRPPYIAKGRGGTGGRHGCDPRGGLAALRKARSSARVTLFPSSEQSSRSIRARTSSCPKSSPQALKNAQMSSSETLPVPYRSMAMNSLFTL
mmetsp:Transcript_24119/g.57452  ORF Transcript_24119/g.57452 Transcript_24119/m.57452 type:complete len:256 (+) Transcript_24119:79-846(+)